jgi:uncharacterized SAM-binding protein YcdF (DUF218 family)
VVATIGRAVGRIKHYAMQEFLINLGVFLNNFLLGEQSWNTDEDAFYSLRAMEANGSQNALQVTSSPHMLRTLAALQLTGVEVNPATTDYDFLHDLRRVLGWMPSAAALQPSSNPLHEIVGGLFVVGMDGRNSFSTNSLYAI